MGLVQMGVQIDEAGPDLATIEINPLAPARLDRFDRRNPTAQNGDIGVDQIVAAWRQTRRLPFQQAAGDLGVAQPVGIAFGDGYETARHDALPFSLRRNCRRR